MHRHSVNFDERFPEYGTESGYHAGDEGTATSPVAMWLDGLDRVLDELPESLLQQVDAISFSGQQHGAVYWSSEAARLLKGPQKGEDDEYIESELTTKHRMKPVRGLRGGLRERLVPGAFTLTDAPIWADASTQDQCDACPEGHFCVSGAMPATCAPGSFASSSNAEACQRCEAGRFQNEEGATGCKKCKMHSWCAAGSSYEQRPPARPLVLRQEESVQRAQDQRMRGMIARIHSRSSVSYTHLTLPTKA